METIKEQYVKLLELRIEVFNAELKLLETLTHVKAPEGRSASKRSGSPDRGDKT